jgi:hypothetical protein
MRWRHITSRFIRVLCATKQLTFKLLRTITSVGYRTELQDYLLYAQLACHTKI